MKAELKKKVITGFIVLAVVFVILKFGIAKYITIKSLKENREWLHALVEKNYYVFLASYFGANILLTSLPLPVTAVFSLAGGLFFGALMGALYANLAATIGSVLFFLFIKYVFGQRLQHKYQAQLKDFNREIEIYGYSYLLSIHFFMVVPLFIVNTLAGLTNISLWTFAWTTVIGLIPGTLIFAMAGQQLMEIQSPGDVFSAKIIIGIMILLFLASLPLLARFYNHKKSKRAQ